MSDPTPPQAPAPDSSEKKSLKDAILANPWPFVALVSAGGGTFAAIAIWAPADVRTALFGAHGALFTFLAWILDPPKR